MSQLRLPPGRHACWILIPREDRAAKCRPVHVARTIVVGCETECGITLKRGWHWDDAVTHPESDVCETCYELVTHLNRVRGG